MVSKPLAKKQHNNDNDNDSEREPVDVLIPILDRQEREDITTFVHRAQAEEIYFDVTIEKISSDKTLKSESLAVNSLT